MKLCLCIGLGVIALMTAVVSPARAQDAATMKVIAGNNQSITASDGATAFGGVLFVTLDKNGMPVPNAKVHIACSATESLQCALTPDGKQSVDVTSNAGGFVVLAQADRNYSSVIASPGAGSLSVTATSGAASAIASLTVDPAYALTIVAGNNQQGMMLKLPRSLPAVWVFPQALQVALKDAAGHPVVNAAVTFSCTAPSSANVTIPTCLMAYPFETTRTTTTDANGIATQVYLPQYAPSIPFGLLACAQSGTYSVTASYDKASVRFSEIAPPPSLAQTYHRRLADQKVCFRATKH